MKRMKLILEILISSLLIITLASCDNEEAEYRVTFKTPYYFESTGTTNQYATPPKLGDNYPYLEFSGWYLDDELFDFSQKLTKNSNFVGYYIPYYESLKYDVNINITNNYNGLDFIVDADFDNYFFENVVSGIVRVMDLEDNIIFSSPLNNSKEIFPFKEKFSVEVLSLSKSYYIEVLLNNQENSRSIKTEPFKIKSYIYVPSFELEIENTSYTKLLLKTNLSVDFKDIYSYDIKLYEDLKEVELVGPMKETISDGNYSYMYTFGAKDLDRSKKHTVTIILNDVYSNSTILKENMEIKI